MSEFRIRSLLLYFGCSFLFLILCGQAEPLKFEARGSAAILMNAETGVVLFEYQSRIPQYPASTTKIATALYALKLRGEELDLPIEAEQDSLGTISQEAKRKANYRFPPHWLEPDAMHIGIKKGEILSLRVLLHGMLIPSGNDAANVIAQALGPSIPTFMEGLNAYLKEMGCHQTYFRNPHGLHDPQHITTAYDLALMGREALKNPLLRNIVSQPRFFRPKTNKQAATTLLQTNRLLRPGKFYYTQSIGIKTGFHAKAKKTVVAAAQSNGRTLIAVLMGYQDSNAIFEDSIKLFEAAFNQPKIRRIFLKGGPQTFTLEIPYANTKLTTYLSESLNLEYYPAEDPQAKCLLYWQPLSLPILKEEQVAELHLVSSNGDVLRKIPLLASEEVRFTWFAKLPSPLWLLVFVAGIILFIVICTWKKSK